MLRRFFTHCCGHAAEHDGHAARGSRYVREPLGDGKGNDGEAGIGRGLFEPSKEGVHSS